MEVGFKQHSNPLTGRVKDQSDPLPTTPTVSSNPPSDVEGLLKLRRYALVNIIAPIVLLVLGVILVLVSVGAAFSIVGTTSLMGSTGPSSAPPVTSQAGLITGTIVSLVVVVMVVAVSLFVYALLNLREGYNILARNHSNLSVGKKGVTVIIASLVLIVVGVSAVVVSVILYSAVLGSTLHSFFNATSQGPPVSLSKSALTAIAPLGVGILLYLLGGLAGLVGNILVMFSGNIRLGEIYGETSISNAGWIFLIGEVLVVAGSLIGSLNPFFTVVTFVGGVMTWVSYIIMYISLGDIVRRLRGY